MTPLQGELAVRVLEHRVPQIVLAARTGFSQKHVSQMLTGTVPGTIEAWQELLDAAAWGYDEQCYLAARASGRAVRMA